MKNFIFLRGATFWALYLIFLVSSINADPSEFVFEGVWTTSKEPTLKNIAEKVIMPLLPYNPTIIEIGKGSESITETFLDLYPKGHLIVFSSDVSRIEKFPSVSFYPCSFVPKMGLDELCQKNFIRQADVIRWDEKEVDHLFIKLSSEIIGTASILSVKTYSNAQKERNSKFITLRRHLECKGFYLITHYYKEASDGEAIFIKKEIYDAIRQ